jgi:hypothetical protein
MDDCDYYACNDKNSTNNGYWNPKRGGHPPPTPVNNLTEFEHKEYQKSKAT